MRGDRRRRGWAGTVGGVRNNAGLTSRDCGALALVSLAAVGGAIAARPYVDVALRLSEGRLIPGTTMLAGLGLGGLVVSAVGLRFPRLAMVGVAGLSLALATTWLGLTDHRFAGPVVAPLSSNHGLHLTDTFAAAPALVGLVALAQALRPRRAVAPVRR